MSEQKETDTLSEDRGMTEEERAALRAWLRRRPAQLLRPELKKALEGEIFYKKTPQRREADETTTVDKT